MKLSRPIVGVMVTLALSIAVRANASDPPQIIEATLGLNTTVPMINGWAVDFDAEKIKGLLAARKVVLPGDLSPDARIGVTLDGDEVILIFEKSRDGRTIRVRADSNQDNDLSKETAVEFAVDRKDGDIKPLIDILRFQGPNRTRPVRLPYFLIYSKSRSGDGRLEESYMYGGHYYAEGTMIIDGKETAIRVLDLLADGVFDFRDLQTGTAIGIDLNGDGAFKQGEYFFKDSLISLAGGYYLADRLAPDGSEITFRLTPLNPVRIGDQAPEIPFTDKSGATLRLGDFRGRPVLLDFWASWCVYCLREFPGLKILVEKLPGQSFEVIGINADEGKALDKAKAAVEEFRLPWRQVMDGKGTSVPIIQTFLSGAETPFSLPYYVLIDARGIVRAGSNELAKIEPVLRNLLDEPKGPGEVFLGK